jgi:DNA invertase Pin-like site-specific DNA recombinase
MLLMGSAPPVCVQQLPTLRPCAAPLLRRLTLPSRMPIPASALRLQRLYREGCRYWSLSRSTHCARCAVQLLVEGVFTPEQFFRSDDDRILAAGPGEMIKLAYKDASKSGRHAVPHQPERDQRQRLVPADLAEGHAVDFALEIAAERPALTQLLTDIEAGLTDVIVVYRIDRLSRSLMDFAKLVEVFDRNKVTFVSVTQSFNTTTSMGRLTLNILLSFTQFAREVIGERIRDKFAASRKRGMWMGGFVPMGYDVKDRQLVVNDAEAKTVRMIFERFVALGSASTLARALQGGRVLNKRGKRIDKGFVYKLINNRVYLGEAVDKGVSYTGEHDAIITRDLWDAVHAILKESPRKRGAENRSRSEALLKGIIFAANGTAMTPTYTRKGERLYHYYTSMDLIRNRETGGHHWPDAACRGHGRWCGHRRDAAHHWRNRGCHARDRGTGPRWPAHG